MSNHLSLEKMDEVYVLAMAGATIRQIEKLANVSPFTAHQYVKFFRTKIKCEHKTLKFTCTLCNYRKTTDEEKLRNLLRSEVIREGYWNVWVKRPNIEPNVYRIMRSKDKALAEAAWLREAVSDPRVRIIDAWVDRFIPTRLEEAWNAFATPGKRGPYGVRT